MPNIYKDFDFPISIIPNDATEKLEKELEKNKILSCLILKDSNIIFQYYKNKKISDTLQKINSCTKSFTGALMGICLDKGLIPDVHTPIVEYFGDYLVKDPDIRKMDITIYHLLTMSTGFYWPEFGRWNCFAPMVYSNDIIRYILSQELETAPGEKMNYNSGCSHLLGAIIQQVAKCRTEDFANEVLFKPMNIFDYKWYENQGYNLSADGLRLKTVDMIKLGYLYLNHGNYKNRQLLSPAWIDESVRPIFHTYDGIGNYGYQWWISSYNSIENNKISFYFALGYMGQFIIVIPALQMVIAMTGRLENSLLPLDIIKKSILHPKESPPK